MKEQIKEILEDIKPDVDFENEKHLIDDHLLDSLSILSLISELEDEFDISISPVEIVNENFNSLDAITYLVNRLQSEE